MLPGVFNVNTPTTPITVVASGDGLLDAWVDFNASGSFDVNEKIFDSVPVVAGTNVLSATTPAWAAAGATYARFRLSPTGGLSPYGLALRGEVEDYPVTIIAGRPSTPGDDTYPLDEDHTLDTNAAGLPSVFGNDTDPDGTTVFRAVLLSTPAFGTLVTSSATVDFATTGHFQYIPTPNFSGPATFTYRVIDPSGLVSNNIATVTINVRAKNDAPTIDLFALATVPPGLTVDEDDPAGLMFTGIQLDDPADDPFDPLRPRQVTLSVEHGVLTLASINGLTLSADQDGDGTPDLDVNGDGNADTIDALIAQTGTNVRAIVIQGTLADLNAAIDGLVYHSDADFNTAIDDERLIVQINDLGYTDQDTAAPRADKSPGDGRPRDADDHGPNHERCAGHYRPGQSNRHGRRRRPRRPVAGGF